MPRALSSTCTSTLPSTRWEVILPDRYAWLFSVCIFLFEGSFSANNQNTVYLQPFVPRCACIQNVHYVVLQAFLTGLTTACCKNPFKLVLSTCHTIPGYWLSYYCSFSCDRRLNDIFVHLNMRLSYRQGDSDDVKRQQLKFCYQVKHLTFKPTFVSRTELSLRRGFLTSSSTSRHGEQHWARPPLSCLTMPYLLFPTPMSTPPSRICSRCSAKH